MSPAIGGTNDSRTSSSLHVPDGSRSFDAGDPTDPSALTAIYRAHSTYVWRVLRHCGVPDADLDDAVQETFLVVFRRLPEFRGSASLRTWIYAVAVRVASTRRRSQRREAARREKAGAQMHGGSAVDPEDELARTEAAELVDRLLDELDPAKRTVFVLAEIEGVKVPEISKILGVNPRTVHSRLRLARERFGTALRRVRAREEGNQRVSRLRPRAVLREAAAERMPARRRKAAAAIVVARFEQGAVPSVPGWETIALSSGGAWTVPAIVATVVGAAGISWAVATPGGTGESAGARETAVRVERGDSVMPAPGGRVAGDAPPFEEAPVVEAEPVPSAVEPAEPSARPKPRRAPPRPSPPAAAPTEASPSSTLAEETRLLEVARASLRRGDGAAALAVLDDYLDRFDRGVLVDEARSTRLRALCAEGRDAEARAYAERLSPGMGESRWDAVVAAACGEASPPVPR